ncbi:MAG: DHHA1 domain-containing protein [Bacteroidales bacterium]
MFKIVSESAVAAGVRRIEALTAAGAEAYMLSQEKIIRELKKKFKTQENILRGVQGLIDENNLLRKDLEKMKKEKAAHMIHDLEQGMEQFNGVDLISTRLEGVDPGVAREIALRLTGKHERLCIVMGYADRGKAYLTVAVSRNIAGKDGLHAGNIVKAFAGLIKGGGGGQAHFATAGGGNIQGIPDAIKEARKRITAIADKQ